MNNKQSFTKKEIQSFKELEKVFKEAEKIAKEMHKNNSKIKKAFHTVLQD